MDTHGEYLLSPRRIAHEMDVPFVDMAKLTHDQVAEMGPELSKKLFMWIPLGRYPSLPQGKVDNTHLNIWGSKVFAAIAAKALSQKCPGCPNTSGILTHRPSKIPKQPVSAKVRAR